MDKIESFIELDINYKDVDDVCLKWNSMSMNKRGKD